MATGIVYDDIYLQHETGSHPENKTRLINTIEHLKKSEIWDRVTLISPRKAEQEHIQLNHNKEYIEAIQRFADGGGGYLDMDTICSPGSFEAAMFAAGGMLEAVDKIIAGELSNALCLVRPPGHHAISTSSMGFCIFNNIAIAAQYIRQKYGIERVAIIDWDVHHGNGTQDAFYSDPNVLYFSMHQYPFYPGTGAENETGSGKGEGFTVNIPLPAGTGSESFLSLFGPALEGRIADFEPQFILISTGFDAYKRDPIGGLSLEIEDYRKLTELVTQIANSKCQGRVVSTLEGGYNLHDLPLCVEQHILGLLGE